MNMRNTVKRIIALGAGATMVGATLLGAMASDLGDYPSPFITADGEFDGSIVIGANAATSDVLGAIDIATSLQREATEEVPIAGGVLVTGGESEEIDLGADVDSEISQTMTDTDLDGFVDSKIRFEGEDYDVHEELVINSDLEIGISGISGDDSEYGADVFLETENEGSIIYKYIIEDSFDTALVNADDSLDIRLLGRNLEITDMDPSTNEMTVTASSEKYMEEGDSIEIDGHTVTLQRVGDSSVRVSVDGQVLTIGEGDSEEFDEAGEYEVEVSADSIFYIEGGTDNSATLKLGDDITDTVSDGEPMELFGEPDKVNDAEWVWEVSITANTTNGITIGAEHNQAYDTKEDGAKMVGEYFALPNDYARVTLASLTDAEYTSYKLSFDNSQDLESESSKPVMVWENLDSDADANEGFKIMDSAVEKESSIIYFRNTGSAHYFSYVDDDGDEINATSATGFQISTGDTDMNVTYTNASTNTFEFTIQGEDEGGSLSFGDYSINVTQTSSAEGYFGATAETSEANEFEIGTTPYGTEDEDILAAWGTIFYEPDANLDDDEFLFDVPQEQVEAIVTITAAGSSSEVTGGTSVQLNNIAVGMAVLDTEASLGSDNYIVVGGPCANSIAFELMGITDATACGADFEEGKAKIVFYDEQNALLVAGYSAQDTMGASRVLANYMDDDYAEGFAAGVSEFEVVIPTLSTISIRTI